MTEQFAFVGDVHGNLDALRGIIDALSAYEGLHTVFLGDYVNKGPCSAEVLELLLRKQERGEVTLLAGNHETALLTAIDTADLTPFIKMGGATTIRSYLRRMARPNVLEDFRTHLPAHHLAGIRSMPRIWETDDVVAQHIPATALDHRFSVSAHAPVGLLPSLTATRAELDTGCGSVVDGRLTALIWPSRRYVQVDPIGRRVE